MSLKDYESRIEMNRITGRVNFTCLENCKTGYNYVYQLNALMYGFCIANFVTFESAFSFSCFATRFYRFPWNRLIGKKFFIHLNHLLAVNLKKKKL